MQGLNFKDFKVERLFLFILVKEFIKDFNIPVYTFLIPHQRKINEYKYSGVAPLNSGAL